MIAVTRGVQVGVDIERRREGVNIAALLKRLGETDLPDGCTSLYSVWTRREAKSKAVGGRLFDRLTADFGVCDLDAPDGYSASLALVGREPNVRFKNGMVLPVSTL